MSDTTQPSGTKDWGRIFVGFGLLLGALSLNGHALYQRHLAVGRTDDAKLEAAVYSQIISADQDVQNAIPTNKELKEKLSYELYGLVDMFQLEGFRDGMPADFLPSDSKYIYLSKWTFSTKTDVHVYLPNTTEQRVEFHLQGEGDVELTPVGGEMKFKIQGPGWVKFGWEFLDNEGVWEIVFSCDGSPSQSIKLPNAKRPVNSGSVGYHQMLMRQGFASNVGWRQSAPKNSRSLPECLRDNWLVTHASYANISREPRNPRDERLKIFVCLESDEPILFTEKEYEQADYLREYLDDVQFDETTRCYIYDP